MKLERLARLMVAQFSTLLGAAATVWGPTFVKPLLLLVLLSGGWTPFWAGAFAAATQPPQPWEMTRYTWAMLRGKVKVKVGP